MPLLASKLQIPPQPHHAVVRERLTDVLEHEVLQYKVVYIAAPAGYGKTTLLTQWAHSSQLTIAWLSISKEDKDLAHFLRYLVTAWEHVQPDIRETHLGLLLSGQSPNIDKVLSTFINVANTSPQHLVFVLDDCHLIEDAAIHEGLRFLLEHLPPNLHFVLSSRGAPPLPLARYRARQELLDIQTEDLQFTFEETITFLKTFKEDHFADEDVLALHRQLEGWIAGLQLVGLTLQRKLTGGDKLVVSGRHRFIADYLSEDVLAPLAPDTRLFLLQTSILDHLSSPICDAVTEKRGSQAMLENLERQNLFLVALDDSRGWFRYHRLFGDFLYDELKRRHPDEVAELHRRAARWYMSQEMAELAFEHGVESNDVGLVIDIGERYIAAKLLGGEIKVVQGWLNSIPDEWYITYPQLVLFRASILLVTGQFESCMQCLDGVEQQLLATSGSVPTASLAKVTALRCYIACFQNDLTLAEALSDQALRDLPQDDVDFRPGIYGALGDTYRRNGYWKEAKTVYLKLLDFSHVPSFRVQAVHVLGALADLDLRQGRLRGAASYWRKALVAIEKRENWGTYPLPLIGWVHIRMGELLYEWNDIEKAWEHVSRGLEYAELGGDVRAMIAGYLLAGRLKLTEGDTDAAGDYLEQTRPLIDDAQFAHWISRFERFQLDVWLAQDRLKAAVDWTDKMLGDAALEERTESEVSQLAMAHVLILKGDELSVYEALRVIRNLLVMSENDGRMGIVIEALMLQAVAHWQHSDTGGALMALERALRLAEPEGYVRSFADFGLPVTRLLQEAHSRGVLVDYVEKLLVAIGTDSAFPRHNQALLEPLTERELEILRLIAAGLTNPEIGEQLVISSETVKKHASNIYGKLGVKNRTEAASRGRALDLLS